MHDTPSSSTLPRQAVLDLYASRIREVANAGMGREDVLKFWFGEPDEVTPEFIRQAAVNALSAGDTFYTQNLGIPALREAIDSVAKNRTLIVIAHRLSTVVDSDQIIVMQDGQVVGSGTHKQLLKSTPLYKELAATQMLD